MASQPRIPQSQGNEKKDNSMLLALLFFLGAGALILWSLMPDTKKAADHNGVVYSKKYEENVNRHLMLTSEKMQLQKQRMMVENNALAPEFQRTAPGKTYENAATGMDLSPDPHAAEVADELGRGERTEASPSSPNEIIQAEVFNQQQEKGMSDSYKEEYARQFIANAAKAGWNVKLSEDYKVLSVTPIRRPTGQMQLFKGAGENAQ